jgi:hypothetical protein
VIIEVLGEDLEFEVNLDLLKTCLEEGETTITVCLVALVAEGALFVMLCRIGLTDMHVVRFALAPGAQIPEQVLKERWESKRGRLHGSAKVQADLKMTLSKKYQTTQPSN